MNSQLMKEIESSQIQRRPDVKIGDTVKLHIRITEGDKSRIQIFQGIVIAMKGEGLNATLTVRKISSGVGVEKIVPLHAPTLEKIEIVKRGIVRRSKLYYMRGRVGKKAMKISGAKLTDGKYDLEDKVEAVVEEKVEDVAEEVDEVSENVDKTAAEVVETANSAEEKGTNEVEEAPKAEDKTE